MGGIEEEQHFTLFTCYISHMVIWTFGYLRDFFAKLTGISRYHAALKRGYAPLLASIDYFYTKRVYHRMQDTYNRPIASAPSARVKVIERYSPDGNRTIVNKEGETRTCLNLGSYNYLGFADDWINTCAKTVLPAVEQFGSAFMSPGLEFGTSTVHRELEATIAEFVGKPAAIVFNMGYGTNASSIPAFMGKGTLILSDALNHTSLVNGARASGATIGVFRHNEPKHLEQLLIQKLSEGQPRTGRDWKKILIVVEGIYSMEAVIVDLRAIVDIAKKYKAYVYVDEAHSIGALGKTGRGICEYSGVHPSEVDILMGTFSKSFAGMGGYIAASEEIIESIRASSLGQLYNPPLSPVVAQQVLTAFNIIMGKDGSDIGLRKLAQLRDNSNYLRRKLTEMGLITLGNVDSTIIPVMLFHISKCTEFSRECLKRNLAVVSVAYPAVPLLTSRVRYCVSSAHTRADLDEGLKIIEEVAELCNIKYLKNQAKKTLKEAA